MGCTSTKSNHTADKEDIYTKPQVTFENDKKANGNGHIENGHIGGGSTEDKIERKKSLEENNADTSIEEAIVCEIIENVESQPNTDIFFIEQDSALYEEKALTLHNEFRSLHGVSHLKLNRELCAAALKWAQHLIKTETFSYGRRHTRQTSSGPVYGENIWLRVSFLPDSVASVEEAVKRWYAESIHYDYEKPGSARKTRQFTQLLWASTTDFGIATACRQISDSNQYKTVIVANYSPAGNIEGLYDKNILQLGSIHPADACIADDDVDKLSLESDGLHIENVIPHEIAYCPDPSIVEVTGSDDVLFEGNVSTLENICSANSLMLETTGDCDVLYEENDLSLDSTRNADSFHVETNGCIDELHDEIIHSFEKPSSENVCFDKISSENLCFEKTSSENLCFEETTKMFDEPQMENITPPENTCFADPCIMETADDIDVSYEENNVSFNIAGSAEPLIVESTVHIEEFQNENLHPVEKTLSDDFCFTETIKMVDGLHLENEIPLESTCSADIHLIETTSNIDASYEENDLSLDYTGNADVCIAEPTGSIEELHEEIICPVKKTSSDDSHFEEAIKIVDASHMENVISFEKTHSADHYIVEPTHVSYEATVSSFDDTCHAESNSSELSE